MRWDERHKEEQHLQIWRRETNGVASASRPNVRCRLAIRTAKESSLQHRRTPPTVTPPSPREAVTLDPEPPPLDEEWWSNDDLSAPAAYLWQRK